VYWRRWWFQLDIQLSLLSAGGKKCITMNPSILVLDEPSAGFNPYAQDIDQFTARIADYHT